jgi:glycosyltransferase involved in cell wall biosynthesis
MPIDWPEPFGVVLIEAMACGTPVVAFNRGSIPEIVDHGVTGFIVEDESEAAAAIGKVHTMSREIAAAHLIGFIEPDGIANMAVFLASDESRMVKGHIYPVDSGITIS